MPIYIVKNELNSAANIWFEGLHIELRIFRLITIGGRCAMLS